MRSASSCTVEGSYFGSQLERIPPPAVVLTMYLRSEGAFDRQRPREANRRDATGEKRSTRASLARALSVRTGVCREG